VFATAAPDGFVAPPLAITKWGSEHPLIEAILSHEDAMSTFDAVTLEVLWNRLISIVDETGATLQRTSFSTIVRESSEIFVDYAGTSPRIERGINCVMNSTYAYSLFAVKCLTNPLIPKTRGVLDLCTSAPQKAAS
jgi:N-methylhydantoinase B/oxoprolinase/acetone carboxylase alpha subunit